MTNKPKSIADLGCGSVDTNQVKVGTPLIDQGPINYAQRIARQMQERQAEEEMLRRGGDNRDGREEFLQLMRRTGRTN